MDFTLKKYAQLLKALKEAGYSFVTFRNYCEHKDEMEASRFIILRHDIDRKAKNALAVAQVEHERGITASYYFRVVEQSNKPEIIKAIVNLGHEIGYHYEDMTISEGKADEAIDHFEKELDYFRQFYPVVTVCMHGSPRSQYDSRNLWKQYDYRDFGIIGEPYFDVDFSHVFYLTDTGRRWDGFNVSIRDRIPVYQDQWVAMGLVYHSTDEIIIAAGEGKLPERLMMTTHPQRWSDDKAEWLMELGIQSAKNVVKRIVIKHPFRE